MAGKTVQDWLRDGDELYAKLVMDYADVERQIQELESRLVDKSAEINQLARILGKPPMSSSTRVTAELMLSPDDASDGGPIVNTTKVRSGRPVNGKFATERVVATPGASRILDSIPGRHAD